MKTKHIPFDPSTNITRTQQCRVSEPIKKIQNLFLLVPNVQNLHCSKLGIFANRNSSCCILINNREKSVGANRCPMIAVEYSYLHVGFKHVKKH